MSRSWKSILFIFAIMLFGLLLDLRDQISMLFCHKSSIYFLDGWNSFQDFQKRSFHLHPFLLIVNWVPLEQHLVYLCQVLELINFIPFRNLVIRYIQDLKFPTNIQMRQGVDFIVGNPKLFKIITYFLQSFYVFYPVPREGENLEVPKRWHLRDFIDIICREGKMNTLMQL